MGNKPSVFARLPTTLHRDFIRACEEEQRTMTAQLAIILREWLAARKQRKAG
jgi:hypothetical protein